MPFTATEFWQTLHQLPAFEPGLLCLLALLLAQGAALPRQYQPWPLLQLLAQRIEHKVNQPNDSPGQRRLAGTLALGLILAPSLLLLWTVRQLSEWPAGFDALLLYLCLDQRIYQRQVAEVADSLQRQQRQLAKDQLQPMLRRDCAALSDTGLAKAGIEVLALRQVRHFAAVLGWYLLGGALAAVAWRMVLELQQSWSGKIAAQRAFSTAITLCSRLLIMPVLWMYGLLVAIMYRLWPTLRYFSASGAAGLPAPDRFYLAAWSAALQRNLGGPVMYQGQKLRRDRIGPAAQPQLSDLQLALRLSRQLQWAVFLLLCCGLGLILLYQWPGQH